MRYLDLFYLWSLVLALAELGAEFTRRRVFGDRLETDMSDTSASDDESEEDDGGAILQVQPREVDVKELEAVKKFVENACGCPELLKD